MQLCNVGVNVKVVEIVLLMVVIDFYREREDLDDNKKENNLNVLSLEEFMEYVSEKMEVGEDMIVLGMFEQIVGIWYREFGDRVEG